jgi:hypothetical protein
MSDGVSPTGGAPQTTGPDATPEARRREQEQAEALLREAFERMLLTESYQLMSESLK